MFSAALMRPLRSSLPRGTLHQTNFEIRTSFAQNNISSKALRADEGGAAALPLKQRPQKENKRKEPQNKIGADDLRPLRSSLTRWCGFVIRTSAVKAENKTVVSEELLKEYCLQQWHRLPQSDPLGTNLRQRGQSRL